MGCTLSSDTKAAQLTNERIDGLESIGPDPDLGWRVMPSNIATTVDPKQFVSYVCPETGRSLASDVLNSFPLYPQGPRLCFFNDRSGQFFAVDVATLALNMSVRAERLAQQFGVVLHDTEKIEDGGPPDNRQDETRSSPRIYELLGVPDCGWSLKMRTLPPRMAKSRSRRSSADAGNDRATLSVEQHLERIGGLQAAVDVPSVGMNIAEQLYRLERKADNSCPLPFNAFGWKVNLTSNLTQRLQVTSPTGELLYLVPEELIMNVTQWVQQTYFTSTAF